MFRRLGWEVHRNTYPSSEELLLARFLKVARPDVILDVGANVGQYAAMLRKCGYAGRIVSFEAIPSVHAELATSAAHDGNWTVAPCCALGRAAGFASINVAGNSVSSSLLRVNELHLRAAPDSRSVASLNIPVARLDEIAPSLVPGDQRLFLKIDTQGYEEEVLMGAERVLDHVYAMQVELSLAPLYEGAPSMTRMLELCEETGFGLYGLMPGFYDEVSGQLLQVDGLFLRAA